MGGSDKIERVQSCYIIDHEELLALTCAHFRRGRRGGEGVGVNARGVRFLRGDAGGAVVV